MWKDPLAPWLHNHKDMHLGPWILLPELARNYVGNFSYFFHLKTRINSSWFLLRRTSVKISYIGHVTQSSLETHHYVDCGANSTAV